ncbi:hypothetical protein PHYBLDRAFT_58570 [Phycomyces blakesleeanus NRRL 1555(-)]|uniref:Uncharacterized protein n=1 Tax=Phycomyces blakesleeanus (strain ATCC 8743b / DSM 1359 / FGSC 10004 / NBRC 33097 / NRRL 1555) TaxID=763407 RepID=A0A163BBU5_PHYB8|nr:hypothetical protein PHYBLDRAFT_58570 [Phycomyces blakesleeanus NRRL 1555(-)]OAD79521.1 hypothetical protein PHYBLDRAFT_58570 [Phycomyces blakesleeanus NRRL 1555(-)]|eukprot:XP_018297561.1 hypothetical protein PHYBLDRAFT_58570 [Phycomyces blakesleeanus NRRL 1555(-)]
MAQRSKKSSSILFKIEVASVFALVVVLVIIYYEKWSYLQRFVPSVLQFFNCTIRKIWAQTGIYITPKKKLASLLTIGYYPDVKPIDINELVCVRPVMKDKRIINSNNNNNNNNNSIASLTL